MTRQNISTGTFANDGSGDTLRQAGQKINDNFIELYNKLGGDSNTLTGTLSISGSGLSFEGATDDVNETVLNAEDPSQDNIITLPNSSGNVVLDSATQTLLNKTLTSPTLKTPRINDTTSTHNYFVTVSELAADRNINLPVLASDDVLVFNDHVATLTNKTLTSPTISEPLISGHIADANGAELIGITATGSAVNHVGVQNAATGTNPILNAVGDDPNVNLNMAGKGSGSVEINKGAYGASTIVATGAADASKTFIISNSATPISVSVADGTTVGEYKIFTNKNAGAATITPANFGPGTSIGLDNNEGCQMIWDGTNWQLIGNNGGTVS